MYTFQVQTNTFPIQVNAFGVQMSTSRTQMNASVSRKYPLRIHFECKLLRLKCIYCICTPNVFNRVPMYSFVFEKCIQIFRRVCFTSFCPKRTDHFISRPKLSAVAEVGAPASKCVATIGFLCLSHPAYVEI